MSNLIGKKVRVNELEPEHTGNKYYSWTLGDVGVIRSVHPAKKDRVGVYIDGYGVFYYPLRNLIMLDN